MDAWRLMPCHGRKASMSLIWVASCIPSMSVGESLKQVPTIILPVSVAFSFSLHSRKVCLWQSHRLCDVARLQATHSLGKASSQKGCGLYKFLIPHTGLLLPKLMQALGLGYACR